MKELRSSQDVTAFFQAAQVAFDGRETEQNWKARDNLCCDLRKISDGEAPKTWAQQYANGVKSALDGIVQCVISERTTLSNHACELVQALARALTSSLNPMLDILFPPLTRLCAAARKISSKVGNTTVLEIIEHSRTYSPRLLHHVSFACADKNDAPRIYAAGWLESLIRLYSHQIESSGGLAQLEKALKLGLNDAHVEARENARTTYWAFAKLWPRRGEEVMSTLDAPKQRALQDHPSNPNKASSKQPDKSGRSSSLAEMRAQAKRELKAKKEAADKDDGFVINPDGNGAAPGPDRKKQQSKPRQEMHQASANTSSQRPLQPISNPTSISSASHSDSTRTASHSKSSSLDNSKAADTANSQRSRPLMAAPVRRAVRVVSTTKPPGRPASREEVAPTPESTPAARPASRNDISHLKSFTPAARPASRSEIPHSKISTPSSRPVSRDQPAPMRHAKASSRVIPVETVSTVSQQPPPPEIKNTEPRVRPTSKYEAIEDPRKRHLERENIPKVTQELPQKQSTRRESPDSQAQLHLQNYIKKIRKLDLSVLGFGRIKRLVETNGGSIFNTEKPFNDLMQALFAAIDNVGQRPPQDLKDQNEMYILSRPPGTKGAVELTEEYRFAILSVIKAALGAKPAYFVPYHQRTVALLLAARGKVDNEDHKVLSLEETADSIVAHCDQPTVITTVLDNIEDLEVDPSNTSSQPNARVLIMGLKVLSDLFSMAKARGFTGEQLDSQINRSANLATECLHMFNPRVRKATVELLVVLQSVMGEKWLEQAFGAEEGTMNMVAYYATRIGDGKASAGELVT